MRRYRRACSSRRRYRRTDYLRPILRRLFLRKEYLKESCEHGVRDALVRRDAHELLRREEDSEALPLGAFKAGTIERAQNGPLAFGDRLSSSNKAKIRQSRYRECPLKDLSNGLPWQSLRATVRENGRLEKEEVPQQVQDDVEHAMRDSPWRAEIQSRRTEKKVCTANVGVTQSQPYGLR